ncbi:MAG: hypothetical protein HY074_18140 [Deltaproteobacteria bacterium]|nr:hypothetical protein [Deltaproteobacteria bacterium]
MKFSRIALAAFLITNTAFAANMLKPPDMKLTKVQKEALLRGFPNPKLVIPPKGPRPDTYTMSFQNGNLLMDGAALTGKFTSGNDRRAAKGYASCTATMERPTMPAADENVSIDESPVSYADATDFESGRHVVVQSVEFKFSIMDRFGTVTHNQLRCSRVSDKPMTLDDIRAGMGPGFSILLSADQTQSIQSMQQFRGLVNGIDQSLPGNSYKVDNDPSAAKATGSTKDSVVSSERTQNFDSAPSLTPIE